MKDIKLIQKHVPIQKVKYFFDCCEQALKEDKNNITVVKEKLMYKDQYSEITAAHACALNGHAGFLARMINYAPELA